MGAFFGSSLRAVFSVFFGVAVGSLSISALAAAAASADGEGLATAGPPIGVGLSETKSTAQTYGQSDAGRCHDSHSARRITNHYYAGWRPIHDRERWNENRPESTAASTSRDTGAHTNSVEQP